MPKIAMTGADKAAEESRNTANVGAQASMSAARDSLQRVRQSAQGTAELGELFTKLFQEQTRHALQVAIAFGQTANWGEIVEIQRDFVRASFRRMNEFNSCYLASVRAVMPTATARDEAGRAA